MSFGFFLDLALKILIYQDLDNDPLTSQEREAWNSFLQWKEVWS